MAEVDAEVREARAVARFVRMSPYKVRAVADLVRGRPVVEAVELLSFSSRAAALPLRKVIESAAANAQNKYGFDKEELYISTLYVDEGPTLRRWKPRARGRATRIRKRSCHITVGVSRVEEGE